MPVSYPAELPPAGLSGVTSTPITSVVEFETDAGVAPSRERVGLNMTTFSVEYPPITQAQYEMFKFFFHELLYDGILPFEFSDPMTGDTKLFRFVGGYNEARITKDLIKISFNLILLYEATTVNGE